MYNLHPFFASFPIVILFLLSLTCIFKSKIYFWLELYGILITILVIACLASFFSGFYALDDLNERQIEVSLFHQQIGRLLMIGSFCLLGCYLTYFSAKNRITENVLDFVILIMCIFAIYVGYHGASLVFDFGLGVKISR